MSVLKPPFITAAELSGLVLAAGEIVYNETAKVFHMGDGVTPGGVPMIGVGNTASETTPGYMSPADKTYIELLKTYDLRTLANNDTVYIGVNGKTTVQATQIVGNGTTATATLSGTHAFVAGDVVNFDGTTNFNGSFTLTAVTGTTLSWASATSATNSGLTLTYARFVQSATAAQIQSAIDAIPRQLSGRVYAVKFYDGYYNLGETPLVLAGFATGQLAVTSNSGTMNAVKVGISVTGYHGAIDVMYNSAVIDLGKLTIVNTNNAADYVYAVYASYNSSAIRLYALRVMTPSAGTSGTTGGVYAYLNNQTAMEGCAMEGGRYGAYLHTAPTASASPVNQGTRPLYGLYIRGGAVCGTAPTGSTAATISNTATLLNT